MQKKVCENHVDPPLIVNNFKNIKTLFHDCNQINKLFL